MSRTWISTVTELVISELEDYWSIRVCRPWAEGDRIIGPQTLREAARKYLIQGGRRCCYLNHTRVNTGLIRPIIKTEYGQLQVIKRRIKAATRHLEGHLVGLDLKPGSGGLAVEVTCVVRRDHHINLFRNTLRSQTVGLTLKQRSLAVVGESVLFNNPGIWSGGRQGCPVRCMGEESGGGIEYPDCGDICLTEAGREACRRRGAFSDPEVAGIVRTLCLPRAVARELEKYLCGVRFGCSFYQRPYGLWLTPPGWAVNYLLSGTRRRYPEEENIFLASSGRNIVDVE